MQLRTRTWFVISLLCFVVAAVFWQLAERKAARDKAARDQANPATNVPAAGATPGANPTAPQPAAAPAAGAPPNAANPATNPFPFRLSNTTKSIDQLGRSAQGIILRNALIDSSAPLNLAIPPHLRADGDPGSFVVQSRGPLTDAYRALLRQAGAEVVSYVPNNAYLVRATDAVAKQLAALPDTQAVLPWEPYYKIDPKLLEGAINQTPLPPNTRLNLLLFPGEGDRVRQALAAMDVVVLSEERSPFGPQLQVRPPDGGLVPLARLPGVQVIEKLFPRKLANDLSRERVRVSINTITNSNYRNLTGEGVLVNVNDTGVWAQHDDLKPRVSGDSAFTLEDFDGHGTHVAGTIASSGANGPTIPPRQVPGSKTNANFRGIAPGASIFALPIDQTFGPNVPDTYLQENAAATNAFISNNSWGYFGSGDYTLASASWDAAVRDALPGATGSQPLAAVFAAGNSGARGIDAPGTAKNVITVGAIENMRVITNEVVRGAPPNQITNQPWLGMTDTNNELAAFSSLGNVGAGAEGRSGRFKPDLVAPGTWVVSTRSTHWVVPTNRFSTISDQLSSVRIRAGRTNAYQTFVPDNGITLRVQCVPNADSPANGLPPLPIQIHAGTPPTAADFVNTNDASVSTITSVPDDWHFSVANTNSSDVILNIRFFVTVTNDVGNEPEVLFNLTEALDPTHLYRYESGTSMAAPVVSGLMALMQEYFDRDLSVTNLSPALMKALLINGARSVNSSYDFNTTNTVTGQGWGLPNLTNSLPVSPTFNSAERKFTSGTMVFYEQTPQRALATGQSFTRNIDVTTTTQPLRFTLVWTDPPGNPAVGVKLVNNLDLVVSNRLTGEVYIGNAIGGGSVFNLPVDTNDMAFDYVNNVENVYLPGSLNQRLGSSYTVSVIARAVNVNAVTAHPDGVVQDYALVISSGNPRVNNAFTVTDPSVAAFDGAPLVQTVTNGIPLLNQRVGANTPLLVSTNGVTNQWRFYVVPNTLPPSDPESTNAAGSIPQNIAFRTFLPPNLGRPRIAEADIDLFVSADPNLTNLDVSVIAASLRSVGRGGSEAVIITNATAEVYYAGVKSEDQQAANFGFFSVSSSSSFSSTDTNGNVYMQGFPFNVEVPDGSPDSPQAGFMFTFSTEPITVQNVVVTNILTHENGGDLFGVLDHNLKISVLNANRVFSDTVRFIYDDSDSGEIPDSRTDAPGSLRNFVGEEGVGSWQLTMVDSAPFYTGQVNRLFMRLEPVSEDLTNGVGVVATILPGRFFRTVIDVPADATNLLVCVSQEEGPVEVYIGRGFEPDRTDYDNFAVIAPPGDCLSLGRRDVPPLSQGRYFIAVYNPNGVAVHARIRVFVQRDLRARTTVGFRSDFSKELFDDAETNSVIFVGRRGVIADLSVGVRIAHPRVSDLVLHLVSPQGTRVLLAENRGGPDGADYGFGSLQELVRPSSSTGGPQASTNVIGPVDTEGVLQVDYNFFTVADRMTVYYDGVLIFDSGLISGTGTFSIDYGPGASTNIVIIMNEGNNPNRSTAWEYTATIVSGYAFATFSDNPALAPYPIKFATPSFTNFNYSVTNQFTNAVILNDSFEVPAFAGTRVFAGQRFSGWEVSSGEIELATLFGQPNPPFFVVADSGSYCIDIAGFFPGAIFTNVTTKPGQDYVVSFAYVPNNANPDPVSAALSIDGATKLSLVIPSGTITNWVRTNFTFRAAGASSRLGVASTTFGTRDDASAIFFDSFKIEELAQKVEQGIYFQPEEPMTFQPFGRLVGENAFGPWTLEVWDNRVGQAATNGSLLSWKLNITFVNTNPPTVTLTNGLAYCATLRSNETAYFLINVPISAGSATNTVTAGRNLNLLYNARGLPQGQQPPDTFFFTDEPGGKAILDGSGWSSYDRNNQFLGSAFAPQIQPGKRYYLAVENRFPGTNAFCIKVQFDDTSGTLVPITPLTNQCLITSSAGNPVSYYSFDVGSNAIGAEFMISNIISGGVDLYVKRNLPVPNPTRFFASSTNPGALDEFIQVADFSGTLLPGRWYLAVVTTSGNPGYQVCAREIPGPILPLTVNTCFTNKISTNTAQYYKVVISSNAYAADFQTLFASGNVDLFISTNTMQMLLTSPTNAMFAATTASGNETISLSVADTNMLLTPGTWYLAVVNKDARPVTNAVCVTESTTNLDYITLTSGVPYMSELGPRTNKVGYYRFDVSSGALQTVFETFGATNDIDLYIRWGFPLPPPATNRFDFASTNAPSGDEWIGLVAGDTNRLLRPGSWWIAVVPKNPLLNTTYKVRATQILSNEVTRLFNANPVCTAIPPIDTNALHSGVQFYRFDIASNTVQALFEISGNDGNVDLYVQRGLTITNYSLLTPPAGGNFLASDQPGLFPDSICLLTNSAPVALSAGTWYVAVVNRETRDVSYCLRASAVILHPLADGVTQCDVLSPPDGSSVNGVDFYVFTAANNAVQVLFETVSMSANVDLYLTKAVPVTNCSTLTADLRNFTYASTNRGLGAETICLVTNSLPVALSGGDWYLAVVNRDTNQFADYCVRATQLRASDFVPISPGTERCRAGLGVVTGSSTIGIDYYVVTVTNGSALMTFETYDATGNVDLYVSHDLCLPNFATFNPSLGNYPYSSVNLGTAPECVMVDLNTVPVPLENGTWYVAVVNRSPVPVNYCFLASEFATNPSVRLTSGAAACPQTVPGTIPGNASVNYYVFKVSSNALQATFETFIATGNVDIYLQYGFCFPHRNTFGLGTVNGAYASTNAGSADEFICLDGASFPAPLKPGDWYVAVVNREATPVNFCIRATERLDTEIQPLTNAVPFTNLLALGAVDFYRYRVSTNAVQVNFEIIQTDANVDLFVEHGFCSSNAFTFSYASTNGGTTNELIVVATNSLPKPLAPGEWFIAVANNDPALNANYTIRVTEVLASDVIRLTNAIPYTNTVAALGSVTNFPVNYYVFNVSTGAVRAQFEILAPSGNVNLIARQGLPLPSLENATLFGTNGGTSAELITLVKGSTNIALTPGDWYLAVLNASSNAVTYSIVATEYSSAGTNVSLGGATLISNVLCFTWVNILPGVNYHVEGKSSLNDPAWVPISPTLRATTNTLTWCVQIPNPYHYFRLVEGLSPLSAGNQMAFTGMSFGTNGVTFRWTAPPNQHYAVEWSSTIAPPSWQPYPDYVTSTNTDYVFTDDGSKTGGLGGGHYYRFFPVP